MVHSTMVVGQKVGRRGKRRRELREEKNVKL